MLKENLQKLQEKISLTCKKIGRNPEEIVLVAVTKNVPVERIKEAISLGIRDIGENRIQEATQKIQSLITHNSSLITGVKWHMVGHLQTNKVKYAVKIFDLIHSVDDFELAQEIDKQAKKINKIQDCLIEVKVSPEEEPSPLVSGKYGCPPGEVEELIIQINQLTNIRLCGLMAMAPFFENPEETRPYFRQAFEIFQEVRLTCNLKPETFGLLSMGMSNDFVIALEEEANMLRIGTAIFGDNRI